MGRQKKLDKEDTISQLVLSKKLEARVDEWANQGSSLDTRWPGVTNTTARLLAHWFERDVDTPLRFHDCQRRAMETLIYCHEVLRTPTGQHVESLRDLYQVLAPEAIDEFEHVRSALGDDHIKYCLKLATGTGKTWILQAALVWMYFNKLRESELPARSAQYSYHFLIVAPGLIVLDRLLDAIRGKKDARGNRDPNKRDLILELFMPEDMRRAFTPRILSPDDINEASEPLEGPFVLLLNWHKIVPKEKRASLGRDIFGDDDASDKSETYLDYLAAYPDMVVFNDEAHHVHDKATRKAQKDLDAQWLVALKKLRDEIRERHKRNAGLFMQVDFSATPFYGTNEEDRIFFPHIIYDYDLKNAMNGWSPVAKTNVFPPLVKQLFLEERQTLGGEDLKTLDFRAIREAEDGTKRGAPIALSLGQKLLLQIGLTKLDQIASEFAKLGINKKPVLYVACEETEVADMVHEELAKKTDARGREWGDQMLVIHSDKKHSVSDDEWEKIRHDLDTIDQPEETNRKRIVVNVMMLREGFDVRNICVAVILRATESRILLEQMVGRGLRLMFTDSTSNEMKREAMTSITEGRAPESLLDFLFIVEHPKFRDFYVNLRKDGYPVFPSGDSSTLTTTGDLERVPLDPARLAKLDLAWPVQIHDEGKLPDPRVIDVTKLRTYPMSFEQVRKDFGNIRIADRHEPSEKIVSTWGLATDLFDYDNFLRVITNHIILHKDGKTTAMSARRADLMDLVDSYVSKHAFGEPIDFTKEENYRALAHIPIHDFVLETMRNALTDLLGKVGYEGDPDATWLRVSQVPEILARAKSKVPTSKCIYPFSAPAPKGGGFEARFMREILEKDGQVLAYSKLEFKHNFVIRYRNEFGILRDYYPDFIVKTREKMWLVETKADRDMRTAVVGRKARAAMGWCEAASRTRPPKEFDQPREWEYVLLSEKTYDNAARAGFGALLSAAKHELNTILTISQGRLF